VVGLVETRDELDLPRPGHDDVGLVGADRAGDVAAQVEGRLEHTVRMLEDLEAADPDRGARRLLLGAPEQRGLLGRVGHPGLAAGEQQVGHIHAARGPPRHRRRRAVLHVVGVRDHAQHRAEVVVGQGRQQVHVLRV